MFGFVFGAACLGGLAALFFHRPRAGCGGRFPRRRGRYALNYLFQRLDTTPGQEKAILAAVDDFRDSASALRSNLAASRSQIAEALRDEHFDHERVGNVAARHAADFATLGANATATLGKIHEALDDDQRKRLARFIESGPHHLCWA